jgi:hypothetical protein
MDPPQTLIKGAPLKLVASMQDPEDGTNLPAVWSVDSADGSPVDHHCDYRLDTFSEEPGAPQAEVRFNRVGSWVISFQTFDHFRAPSNTSTVVVQVVDAPPALTGKDLKTLESKDACNSYVAGQPLPVYLDGSVMDPDAVLDPAASDCNARSYSETFSYRWELTGPATSHAVVGPKPSKDSQMMGDGDCPATPAAGLGNTFVPGDNDYPLAVCVYPDVGSVASPDMYQIVLAVSDGTTEVRSNVFDAPVRADVPPCLTGAAPDPGSYVVDRNDVQRFTVTGASDDLDPFPSSGLTFQWSIWREQDPVWRTVPDWALSTYELDTSGFAVGEKLRVRVTPADRNGVRVSCDEDQSVCTTDSCLTSMCQAWMTWDLELR